MNNLTREHIIDLINQYIYTNGTQSITAAQLHEILLEIANAFAMEGGGGSTGDISAVLQTGNQVTEGQTIVNENGGSVLLASHMTEGDTSYDYLGLDFSRPAHQGFVYNSETQILIGNLKRTNPSRNVFNMADGALEKGESMAFVSYLSEIPGGSSPIIYSAAKEGKSIASQNIGINEMRSFITRDKNGNPGSSQTLSPTAINQMVEDDGSFCTVDISPTQMTIKSEQSADVRTRMYIGDGEFGYSSKNGSQMANRYLTPDSLSSSAVMGSQMSSCMQDVSLIASQVVNGATSFSSTIYENRHVWTNQVGPVAEMNGNGLSLQPNKVVELTPPSGANKMTLSAATTGGTVKVDGTGVLTTDAPSTVLKSNRIQFFQGTTGYASFTSSASSLNSPLTLTSATYPTAFSSTHSTPGGDNIAIYASAINGVTNTAVLAESGNVVIKNGSAMIGFDDMDMTPEARLDIQAQGDESSAIRVRNIEDNANVMEVRGNGNVLMGQVSSPDGSNVLHIANGSAPSNESEDAVMIYSDALETDGNVVPHFLTGKGQLIRLYQQGNDIGDAVYSSRKGVALSDADTFDGFTLKQVVKALINLGLLK